jgi:tRNA threonylcarbamoyladenosine biosynthesis protein TsaE
MLILNAATVHDLSKVAHELLNQFSEQRVFALHGPMGAGKTTLIKALCNELGVDDVVVSPTFALINEYRIKNGEPVYHFDFYRINSLSEVFDMGYEEYFYSGHYCFVEWPEKIEQLLPAGIVYINIHVKDDNHTRTIKAR